jgi:hypothetical protein
MPDEIRPPPFPKARDEITEPGIGINPEVMTLRRENMRLRRERNAAKEELAHALTSSAPGVGSIPPDLTRKQRTLKTLAKTGGYTLLVSVLMAVAPMLAKKWPAYADVITAVLQNLNLQ